MALEQLMERALPLNRKERFYTGTVLPQIVLADGGAHFARLTRLLPNYREQPLDWTPEGANVQFFTEYSFVESLVGADRRRFRAPPRRKDTPDVMILIDGAPRVLIAIEAKMFDRPLSEALRAQLAAQRTLLAYLERELGLDALHHCALLPERLAATVGDVGCPVISWEHLHAAFCAGRREDYFLRLLRIALDRYDALAAPERTWGRNADAWLTGGEIYGRWRRGEPPALMGRTLGLDCRFTA